MKDYIFVGSSPADEPCAGVGEDGYYERAHKECHALIRQLRRENGPEPVGARLKIKSNPHDFGTYYEVICEYDSDNELAADYAFKCENLPENWDEEAKKELHMSDKA